MRNKRLLILTMVILIFGSVSIIQSQPRRGPDKGGPGMHGPGMGKHVEQLRLLKLLEMLDLEEDQELEFMVSFRSLRRSLKELDREKGNHIQLLADGIYGGDITDDDISEHIKSIRTLENEKRTVANRFIDESEKNLAGIQLAKLVIFQERFERELLDRVRAFRDRGRHGLSGDTITGQRGL